MFKKKEWKFSGRSGKEYTFGILSKLAEFPEFSGIYILSYTHPRGHLSGFMVHLLYAGKADNLKEAISAPLNIECLKDKCWNSIHFLKVEDQVKRSEILNDIIQGNNLECMP